jgi:predicted ATP-grasp superfamily ATP-dependent carboligase
MLNIKNTDSRIRILLSEGSSTNVREMITALGPLGYIIDICDPDPYCMGRFSSYIRKVYRCPKSGDDPVGYLKFVIRLIKEQGYDVLFPANEQAFLFSWAREYLSPLAGLAVSDFLAFRQLQTKSAFMRFLVEVELPHPPTRYAKTWDEISAAVRFFGKPCYVKTDYGTASTGVWRIENDRDLASLKASLNEQEILNGQTEFLVQEASKGSFEQLHAIFDQGRLIAIHCTSRLKEGLGGGAIVKAGVNRPIVRQNLVKIGSSLKWHGSLSVDYFYNEAEDKAYYIDANPRITEPMNAAVNGINLADMQVRLSMGELIPTSNSDHIVSRSHSTIQALLAAADRRHSRHDVLKEMCRVTAGMGIYKNSREGVTPVAEDFPSIVPLCAVLFQLLLSPGSGRGLAQKVISNYSLGSAIPKIAAMKPDEHLFYAGRGPAKPKKGGVRGELKTNQL